jgi:NADH-quinone oxidoreductase subunit G
MVETRDDVVVRLRPRPNLDVNRHFMCDTGRLDYRWMNRGDRIEAPLVREGAKLVPTDWDHALARLGGLAKAARTVTILASGRASTESLGLLRRLVDGATVTAAIKIPLGTEAPLAGVPNLALRRERTPNVAGATLAGYSADWSTALASAKSADLVVVLDAELDDAELASLAGATVVVIATVDDDRLHGAALLLPTTNVVEENGTYVNRDQRVQRFFEAKSAPGMARPAWWIAAEATHLVRGGPVPATAADAFVALGAAIPALAGLTYQDLGHTGRVAASVTTGAAR